MPSSRRRPPLCKSAQLARKSTQTNPAPTDKTARTNCRRARPNPPSAHSGNARANSQNCHVRPPAAAHPGTRAATSCPTSHSNPRCGPLRPRQGPSRCAETSLRPGSCSLRRSARPNSGSRAKPPMDFIVRSTREPDLATFCHKLHERKAKPRWSLRTSPRSCETNPSAAAPTPSPPPSVSPRTIQRWEGSGIRPHRR